MTVMEETHLPPKSGLMEELSPLIYKWSPPPFEFKPARTLNVVSEAVPAATSKVKVVVPFGESP